MPFIPHTDADVAEMLAAIGVPDVESLFDEIPSALRSGQFTTVGDGLPEMEVLRRLGERARQDEAGPCFLGAGSYDHHVPAAVWDIAGRGEFMTAYTPYQAEASQGTLQLIYEFQTMMSELTGMDVCNASVYDGGSGLAEAVLMAVRANRRGARGDGSRVVAVAGNAHPLYVAATRTIVRNQGIEIVTLPHGEDGLIDPDALSRLPAPPTAVVLQQPNFFGLLDNVDQLTDRAHEVGALVVACVNPVSLALLKPPCLWGKRGEGGEGGKGGERGADIVCGDGQPLGVPMASGGPSFGFICTRRRLVRQLPGRIVGRTEDLDGRPGFTLTLQAREQHIRRAKATSNICTNQGLLVTAATVYMSLLGPAGLRNVAAACHARTLELVRALELPRCFEGPFFHECVLDVGRPADEVVTALAERGVVAGLALGTYFPELAHGLLVCATEKRTGEEMRRFAQALAEVRNV